MQQRNELVAYALDFVSYLIEKADKIDRIILHGSVSRGDFDEESDIDLFIDCDKKFEKKINEIIEDYYNTEKFKKWKLKGIENSFSCIIGKLDSNEWKELKRSIMNTGIILYGKYKAEAEKINQYTLFSFENIKPDKKRIAIFRKLFGFKVKGKRYPGFADEVKAVRIGKGCLLVQIENTKKLSDYFKNKKTTPKIYDFWSDTKVG